MDTPQIFWKTLRKTLEKLLPNYETSEGWKSNFPDGDAWYFSSYSIELNFMSNSEALIKVSIQKFPQNLQFSNE